MFSRSSPRRHTLVLAGAAVALMVSSAAQAAPAAKTLKTFGTGEVTATSTAATIVNDAGEYGGVYLQSKSQSGKLVSRVDFQFRSTGDVGGGAPRFSLPIDADGDGATDGYAFLDAANCGGTSGNPILVSTESGTCPVFYGSESHANWDAFAAAHPAYRMSPGAIPFIIADVPGSYAVDGIALR